MNTSQIVGRRIFQARKDLALSQNELGQRLGELLEKPWFPQAVAEAEKGRRQFTAEELLALARVLDRPVAWFFIPPASEDVEFPSRTVPFGELVNGPLLGGVEGNAAQALVEEGMAIVNALSSMNAELGRRAKGLIAAAEIAAKRRRKRK